MKPHQKGIFKKFFPYILPYKKLVGLSLINILSISILGVLTPLIIRLIFDEGFPNRNLHFFLILILFGFLIEALRYVLEFLRDYIDIYISQRVQHDIRSGIFHHFELMQIEHYGNIPIGDHLWRLNQDSQKIQEMVAQNIPKILQTSLDFIFLLAITFWLDWRLTIAALLVIPIYFLNSIFAFDKLNIFNKSIQERDAEANSFLRENISGIEDVKVNNAQIAEHLKYMRKIKNKIYAEVKGKLFYLWYMMSNRVPTLIWSWSITAYAGYHVISGDLTVGGYVAVTTYLLRIFGPLNAFTQIYSEVMWQLVSGERLMKILDQEKEFEEIYPLTKEEIDFNGDIEFQNVTFTYKKHIPSVLTDLSLKLLKGQKIALVGPIGCGKSTLIKLLLKLYQLNQGAIIINGHNIAKIHNKTLREKIGVVMQKPFIFNDTILNNIKYSNKRATDEDVLNILKMMNVYEYFLEFEEGLEKVAGEDGSSLSGGQKQLIAIARAYLKNPTILIFDEATSSLDTFTEMKIVAAMRKLMEGRTTIMIAHRLSSIKQVDRILYMRDGKIVEDGTLQQLLDAKGYYFQIFSQHYGGVKETEAKTNENPNQDSQATPKLEEDQKMLAIWDLSQRDIINAFSGKVNHSEKYCTEGEIEINTKGHSGYCTDLCVAEKIPKKYSGKMLAKLGLDLYIPEISMDKNQSYILLHVITQSPDNEWYEIGKREIHAGWNYLLFDISDPEKLLDLEKIFFVFNTDGIFSGPIYLSNIRGNFVELQ